MAVIIDRRSTLDYVKKLDFYSFQPSDIKLIQPEVLQSFTLFLIKELDKKRSPQPSQDKLVTNQLESILSQMKELRQDNQALQTMIKLNGNVSKTNIETCIGKEIDKQFQAHELINGGVMNQGNGKPSDEIMNRIDEQFEKHNIPLIYSAVSTIKNAVKDMDLNITQVASNVDTNIKKSMNNNKTTLKNVEATFSNKLLSSSNANNKVTPGAQFTVSNGKGGGFQYEAKKTVIITGFTDTALKDSQSLKRAISQYFPFIGIDLAFRSIKGTITFQFKTEAEADKVVDGWQDTYFLKTANNGNKSKASKPNEGKVHGVIMDTPLIWTDEQFEEIIKKTYEIEDKSCRRMIIKGRPSPLISVKFKNTAELTKAVTEGLLINESTSEGDLKLKLNVEESRRKKMQIIRCYNCQKFGSHIARLCNSRRACVNCSEDHVNCEATERLKCANCEGPHKADSTECPKFKAYKDKIDNSASR